jgi:hypothetical protein
MEVYDLEDFKENEKLDIMEAEDLSKSIRCYHDTSIYLHKYCIICNPELACIHNNLIHTCVKCNIKDKYMHSKLKYFCIFCRPKSECDHGLFKQFCIFCYNVGNCIHNYDTRRKKNMCICKYL